MYTPIMWAMVKVAPPGSNSCYVFWIPALECSMSATPTELLEGRKWVWLSFHCFPKAWHTLGVQWKQEDKNKVGRGKGRRRPQINIGPLEGTQSWWHILEDGYWTLILHTQMTAFLSHDHSLIIKWSSEHEWNMCNMQNYARISKIITPKWTSQILILPELFLTHLPVPM